MVKVNSKLRISTISFGYPPDSLGGAEIYAHRLSVKFLSMGYRIKAYTAVVEKKDVGTLDVDGIALTRMAVASRPPFSKFTYTYNPGTLRRDFGQGDIVHVHNFGAFSPTLFTNLRRTGRYKGVVWTAHDYLMMCPRQTLLRINGDICDGPSEAGCNECKGFKDRYKGKVIKKHFIPNIDRFLAPSAFMMSIFKKAGFPMDRCRLVYNGIDLEEFEMTDVPTEPIIMFLGQMLPHKGLEYLVEAMPIILKDIPDARLMVIGKGPQLPEIKKKVKHLDIEDSVRFFGHVPDVKVYYQKAKVIALPSVWHENCSLVLLEGSAMGRPIVATHLGGNPEIVKDGETGLLVRPADPIDLAEKLVKVLSLDGLATSLGKAARSRAERMFSMDIAAGRNLAIYEELLAD